MLSLNKHVLSILYVPATLLGARDKVVSKNIQDVCSHGAYILENTDNQIISYKCNLSAVRKGGPWHCGSL